MHNVIQDEKKTFKTSFFTPDCLTTFMEIKVTTCTYLTTDELSQRIKYDTRTIRDRLKDSVLLEGRHYIKPFGGRKTLYIWEAIEEDIGKYSASSSAPIVLSNGGMLHV